MAAAVHIAAKDLRQRIRDRSAIMLAVVVPLALAAIFSLLFGPASTPSPFAYGVADADHSDLSRAFTSQVLAELDRRGIVTVTDLPASEARAAVRDGDLDAAFVFPAGFAQEVRSERPVSLDVVGSVDAATATDVARSVATSYVEGLNAARVAVAGLARADVGLSPADIQQVAEQTVHGAAPVDLKDTSATAKLLDTKTYFAAGMAVFFLMFTVQFGVSSLIEERTEGTLPRLLAAPVSRASIVLGKLLTSVVLGVVSVSVLVVGTTVLLGASWGNPAGVALLIVAGVLAATGITSLIASLARTSEQAGSWQAVVAVTLGMLGGAFFPIQQSGSFMATVSLVTPHAWFMRGLGNLAGGGVADVLPAVLALLLIAAVTGAVALRRVGRVVAP
jgi:linearmycin/streptolysin S transport system permease protein